MATSESTSPTHDLGGWDASELVDLLDVRSLGDGAFETATRPGGARAVVEGSQMLGQAIVAACRTVPGRRVVSSHMVFARVADTAVPLRIELDEVSNGRTFSAFSVNVLQKERRCAAGTLLLDATAPDLVRHADDAPDVGRPEDAAPYDMGVAGREVRVVGGAYDNRPDAPTGPPVLDAWIRFAEAPDDAGIRAGLVAQFCGHMSIAAALRPHAGVGQGDAHRTLSTAINAIALSFHADPRPDQWMLYHHRSTFAGDGMTRSECRVHGEEGGLVASFGVDAMVRGFAGGGPSVAERQAL